jgi:hypothetical protein
MSVVLRLLPTPLTEPPAETLYETLDETDDEVEVTEMTEMTTEETLLPEIIDSDENDVVISGRNITIVL